ncbi:MAG TPA: putative porin, partial [Pseudomonadales bacterium]|nr:putative porin [Pseudomonadales bacterium]
MFKRSLLISAIVSSAFASHAYSAEADQTQTMQKLIKTLVEQKVISEQKGQELLKETQQQQTNEKGVVKVQQVPQFIQDDIRQKVKAELHEDVVNDVMNQAKTQAWGVPGTLPGWIDSIKFKTDFRLRAESSTFGRIPEDQIVSGSSYYLDYNAINSARNLVDSFQYLRVLNEEDERDRLRYRARLQMDTKINPSWKTSFRISTGGANDPVSTNQTLGAYGKRSNIMMDQAFIKYDGLDADRYNWFTFTGGRMANPFVSTDLVWDADLAFDGVAATYRFDISSSGDLLEMNDRNRTLFVTVGAFPLQEYEFSTQDKWLYAGQVGTTFILDNQDTFTVALAYYDYDNIVGQKNAVDDNLNDWTAPQFMQKGNTLYNLAVSSDPSSTAAIFGLASDYNLVDLTAS